MAAFFRPNSRIRMFLQLWLSRKSQHREEFQLTTLFDLSIATNLGISKFGGKDKLVRFVRYRLYLTGGQYKNRALALNNDKPIESPDWKLTSPFFKYDRLKDLQIKFWHFLCWAKKSHKKSRVELRYDEFYKNDLRLSI